MRRLFSVVVMFFVLVGFPGKSESGFLDLTNPGVLDSGFIDSAFFQWTDIQATGTGQFDTFVQLGDATPRGEVIEGYNTKVNNVFDNKSSDIHNHQIPLFDVPIVNLSGTNYREFLLDINEPVNLGGNNPNSGLLSLDEIQIFLSDLDNPNQSFETFTSSILDINGDLIYRLDTAQMDSYIKLDAGLQPGGGKGDMLAYIPDSLFQASTKEHVYLYSRFGENYVNDGGFEEWKLRDPSKVDPQGNVVPEPATVLLFAGGLLGACARRRRKS